MLDIEVIDINRPENAAWREAFERYRHDVVLAQRRDEKWRNYTPERFAVDQQLGTFLMIDRAVGRIAAFVAVQRPPHWPAEVARMGSRTWVDPDYRARGLSSRDRAGTSLRTGNRWGVTYAYEPQIECCRRHGVRVAVMSRENRPGKANTTRVSWLGLIKVHPDWRYDDDLYFLTCQQASYYGCWQKMVWTELEPESETFLRQIPTISAAEFDRRFRRSA